MYGIAGERRLPEQELGWLDGYEASLPVRVGNAAATQLQLDVYGEVLDSLFLARTRGMQDEPHAWAVQHALMNFLESAWQPSPTRVCGRCGASGSTSSTPR